MSGFHKRETVPLLLGQFNDPDEDGGNFIKWGPNYKPSATDEEKHTHFIVLHKPNVKGGAIGSRGTQRKHRGRRGSRKSKRRMQIKHKW